MRRRLPDALYLDLLDPALHRRLSARPERLRELMAGAPGKDTVVIDEVQRIPELLTVVHAVLEEPAPPRFVLTGSSARKLRRGGVDLLGGRAVLRTLHPFMAAELPDFDLGRALRIGLLPLVAGASDPAGVLDAYASLYLDQEVRAEGLTRNVGAFARFLEAVAFSHGAQLNVSAVARECEVERKVAAGYVGILEDLLLAFRLPVFRRRAKRATVAHEKLYLFRCRGVPFAPSQGAARPPRGDGGAGAGGAGGAAPARVGRVFEARCEGLFSGGTRAGAEVELRRLWRDGPPGVRGQERGQGAFPRSAGAAGVPRGLARGGDRDAPPRPGNGLRIDGVWCLPVEDFLRRMAPDRGLLAWL